METFSVPIFFYLHFPLLVHKGEGQSRRIRERNLFFLPWYPNQPFKQNFIAKLSLPTRLNFHKHVGAITLATHDYFILLPLLKSFAPITAARKRSLQIPVYKSIAQRNFQAQLVFHFAFYRPEPSSLNAI